MSSRLTVASTGGQPGYRQVTTERHRYPGDEAALQPVIEARYWHSPPEMTDLAEQAAIGRGWSMRTSRNCPETRVE